MGLFNNFPYTNLHDLNLDWAIDQLKSLFTRGEALYAQLQSWKDTTDAELAAWKASTMAGIQAWETQLLTSINAWETQLRSDMTTYQTNLTSEWAAWKTQTQADLTAQLGAMEAQITAWEQTAQAAWTATQAAAEAAQAAAEAAADEAETSAMTLVAVSETMGYDVNYNWSQGGIASSTQDNPGSNITASSRVRTNTYIPLTHPMLIQVDEGYEFAPVYYAGNTADTWVRGGAYTRKQIILPSSDFAYIRLTGRYSETPSSAITPTTWTTNSGILMRVLGVKTYAKRTADYINFDVEIAQTWNGTPDTTLQCILALPSTYDPMGKPTPLILMAHGSGGHINGSTWYNSGESSSMKAIAQAYKNVGFAVFDVDNTRAESGGWEDWGCLPLMSAYLKAMEYIKATYNIADGIYIHSFSMGTAVALNMCSWYPGLVRAAVMTAPRPDIELRYSAYTSQTQRDQMIAAFELQQAGFTDYYNGFLGYKNMHDGRYDLLHCPTKVLIGGSDVGSGSTSYETKQYNESLELFNAAVSAGTYVEMRIVSGYTHTKACFLPDAAVRQECAKFMAQYK